jgi:hypothetical protein
MTIVRKEVHSFKAYCVKKDGIGFLLVSIIVKSEAIALNSNAVKPIKP